MGLTFDQEAKLIRENPDLSDGAILLLKLIIFRMYVTNLKDSKGRFIYLVGDGNDPKKVYGWTRSKTNRMKKELKDKGYISVGQKDGYGKGSRVYLNDFDFSIASFFNRFKSEAINRLKSEASNRLKSEAINSLECEAISKERSKKGVGERSIKEKKAPPIAVAPSAHTPQSSNPFKEMLTDGISRPDNAVMILKVLSYLCDSFPTKPDKFPNPKGTAQSWYKSLGKYQESDLMNAIEDYKAKKPFFPSIAEIKSLADYHRSLRHMEGD